MFLGRQQELFWLQELLKRKTAAFVVCRGRRRIGKSTLIEEFAKQADIFLEFQGLAPRDGLGEKEQLQAFASQLAKQTRLPELRLDHWAQAFSLLASVLKSEERTVLFLDEISWMASASKDFAGQLKIAWDTEFKKYPKLILVVCGSVSTWIEQNILNNTGFVGRVSLDLPVAELPLPDCNRFWSGRGAKISSAEKLKILSVTGGVPRYLEEVNPKLSAEENIKRLCFSREGILYSEFEHIFSDIFSKKAKAYQEIVQTLLGPSRTLTEICQALKKEKTGHVSDALNDLVISGFVEKDFSYAPGEEQASRFFKFRLKDNYLRFYLKYIRPRKAKIEKGLLAQHRVEDLVPWETVCGYQFENLVLNNLPILAKLLSISPASIRSASPYFQKSTQRQKACQIDLLIQTKHSLYLCEIKFRGRITREVIAEMQRKAQALNYSSTLSLRPVLIYEGRLELSEEDRDYFDHCVEFGDFLVD